MGSHYSLKEKKRGRRGWLLFSMMNIFSMQFLAGNILILFIIRLDASKTLVGVFSSFFYISYFFMPLGILLSKKMGIVRGFRIAWGLRYLVITPVILAPLIVMSRGPEGYMTALLITIFSFSLFQIIRGAGMASFSPILTELSHGPDRGSYLSKIRIITDASILLGVLAVALVLGKEASFIRYMISFSLGITLGFAGVISTRTIPEIHRPEDHKDESLLQGVRSIFLERKFRRYFAALCSITFLMGIIRTFVLVFSKDVYLVPDNRILFLSVAGSLGAITMGMIAKANIDRIGAKPLLMISSVLMVLTCAAILFIPEIEGWMLWVFLTLLFFLSTMGLNGADNTTQAYFYSIITPKQQLNFGVLFYLTAGISSTLGGVLAGVLLDWLQGPKNMEHLQSHRILFGILILLLFIAMFFISRMEKLGAMSLKGSLEVIFRPRHRNRS